MTRMEKLLKVAFITFLIFFSIDVSETSQILQPSAFDFLVKSIKELTVNPRKNRAWTFLVYIEELRLSKKSDNRAMAKQTVKYELLEKLTTKKIIRKHKKTTNTLKSTAPTSEKVEKQDVVRGFWICDGALLSAKHVVTSATCVANRRHMSVVAGAEVFGDEEAQRRVVIMKAVPKVFKFSSTDPRMWMKRDAAVLTMDYPFVFDDTVSAVGINSDLHRELPGTFCQLGGWGDPLWKAEANGTRALTSARIGATILAPGDICQSILPEYSDLVSSLLCGWNIKALQCTNRSMCFESPSDFSYNEYHSTAPCQNNFGSPLICEGRLIGLTVYLRTSTEGQCSSPVFYTSVRREKYFLQCVVNDRQCRNHESYVQIDLRVPGRTINQIMWKRSNIVNKKINNLMKTQKGSFQKETAMRPANSSEGAQAELSGVVLEDSHHRGIRHQLRSLHDLADESSAASNVFFLLCVYDLLALLIYNL